MRFSIRTLFLACAIFLDFIESIISAKNLEELFPDNNGVLPPMKLFPHDTAYDTHEFRKLNGHYKIYDKVFYLKRGPFVFGYRYLEEKNCNIIYPLGKAFYQERKCVVFDTERKQWEEIEEQAMKDMGVTRNFAIVELFDELAALHDPAHNEPLIDRQAHVAATAKANHFIKETETEQARLLRQGATKKEESLRTIREEYNHIYSKEFELFKLFAANNREHFGKVITY